MSCCRTKWPIANATINPPTEWHLKHKGKVQELHRVYLTFGNSWYEGVHLWNTFYFWTTQIYTAHCTLSIALRLVRRCMFSSPKPEWFGKISETRVYNPPSFSQWSHVHHSPVSVPWSSHAHRTLRSSDAPWRVGCACQWRYPCSHQLYRLFAHPLPVSDSAAAADSGTHKYTLHRLLECQLKQYADVHSLQ